MPRRVSGPVRVRRPRARVAPPRPRALELVRGLPDHPLLDRIVRGRVWIPLLGVMLAGIVAMQVEVLKLSASIGRSIALSTTLSSRNQLLRASVSSLSDAQRIEALATRMGMVMPGPTAVSFLDVRRAYAALAADAIHHPDGAVFLSTLQPTAPLSAAATPGATTALPATATPTSTISTALTTTLTPTTTTPAPAATPTATPAATAPTTPTTTAAPTTAPPATTPRAATGGAGAAPTPGAARAP
jgi:hypothetical protein